MEPATTPDRRTIVDRLAQRLAELLRLESTATVTEQSKLREDLGVDSLGLVDLVTLVEEDFSIRFATNTDLSDVETVGDVAGLVEDRLRATSSG